jgi:hypothetical protein
MPAASCIIQAMGCMGARGSAGLYVGREGVSQEEDGGAGGCSHASTANKSRGNRMSNATRSLERKEKNGTPEPHLRGLNYVWA